MYHTIYKGILTSRKRLITWSDRKCWNMWVMHLFNHLYVESLPSKIFGILFKECYWWYFKLTVLSTVWEVTCPCSINSIDLIWGFLQESLNQNSSQINHMLHCMCEIYMASIKIILLHFNYTSVMNTCQVKLQFYNKCMNP